MHLQGREMPQSSRSVPSACFSRRLQSCKVNHHHHHHIGGSPRLWLPTPRRVSCSPCSPLSGLCTATMARAASDCQVGKLSFRKLPGYRQIGSRLPVNLLLTSSTLVARRGLGSFRMVACWLLGMGYTNICHCCYFLGSLLPLYQVCPSLR